jgi:hypothetical protein
MSECIDYDATYLGRYGIAVKGKLLLFSDRVVFEPVEEEGEKIEIPVSKIRDARLATDKDISALRVWLLGPALGAYFKTERRLLIIDTEDELGIMKHLVFEGDGMEEAAEALYEIRRREKMGPAEAVKPEPVIKKELEHGNWRCPRCLRINAANANLCTRCGESKPA